MKTQPEFFPQVANIKNYSMTQSTVKVYLNRFPIKKLAESERTVQVYQCNFKSPPELGEEYSALNKIPWNIGGTSGVRFGSNIIIKERISDAYLSNEKWTLQHQETKLLNLENTVERIALERLERRWLGNRIKRIAENNRVDRASEGGFIWWNADRKILQDSGWEVHTGVRLDLELHHSGVVFLEIDSHHRIFLPD